MATKADGIYKWDGALCFVGYVNVIHTSNQRVLELKDD